MKLAFPTLVLDVIVGGLFGIFNLYSLKLSLVYIFTDTRREFKLKISS